MQKTIKLYGLVSVTKKQYINVQLVGVVVLAIFWAWAIFGDLNTFLFGYGILILAAVTVGEIIETTVALRKFNN